MEVMFADFLSLCMDQIYNHAVKFPGMFPDVAVPLVIRTPAAAGAATAPRTARAPSTCSPACRDSRSSTAATVTTSAALLIDAVLRWPYPVLFLEHKLLYGETADPANY